MPALRTDAASITPQWRRAHACSGTTSRLILSYVERQGGRRAVEELLARAAVGETEARLRDENAWFSYETKLALWGAAEEVLGDRSVARDAGAAVLDFTVGMALKRTLRALGTPEFVYRNVVRANSKFNWAHRLEFVERTRDQVRLRYVDVSGCGYHRYDCDYTAGLLSAVPQLFGLPAARVNHSVCGGDGAPACEFEVEWTAGLQGQKRAAVALAAGGAVAAAALGPTVPAALPFVLGSWACGELAIAARALVFHARRLRVLEARVREQDDAAERLLSSLGDLSADLRLDEVLDKITAKAQGAVGGKEFALLLVDGERLRADRHSNISDASLGALEAWAADHRDELLERGATMVDDLASSAVLSGLARDPDTPFGSLCAAPLVFGTQLLGVLVALAHGSTVFLPNDLATLSAYAAHAAIALRNAHLVDRLEREAAEDPLTGLANQRAFYRVCSAEFSRAERGGGELSIVILDLDHFKAINDERGHPYGDRVLSDVAGVLRATVRPHDTAARLGGEEFALLLPGTDAGAAREIAERARAAIARVPVDGRVLSASAGVASGQPAFSALTELLAIADDALYEAKRAGRNLTVVAPPSTPAIQPA